MAELCRRILLHNCTFCSEFGMFSPLQHLWHSAEQSKRCQTHDGSFGCPGRAKEKQPATKFLHEDLFSWLGMETGRSFVGWGCQNKLHPSPAPFSLEEGAAVNLFICLCSMNWIREKAWKKQDKVPPAHGDEHRDEGFMLEAVEEFQRCFHILHPAFHAFSSRKNVVFTFLPGKTIRNVDCSAQEVQQGLARKGFSLLVNRKTQPFPTFSTKVAEGFQGKWDYSGKSSIRKK